MVTEDEKRIRRRLRDDFSHYAAKCLKIRTKAGSIERFELNNVQKFIHARIEEQLRESGWVRAYILKGRQQGVSTYVEGRFFWKVTHRRGIQAFILTHRDDATQNIFGIAQRYYDHCPDLVRPHAGKSSEKELSFDLLDAGYRVGTAKSKGTGRSSTIQYFHGSEVAFWANAKEHLAGIMQAIPEVAGTEVILESTGYGMGNEYHQGWQAAERGASDYIAIFIPWYWQPEYRRQVPEDFRLDKEDLEYMEAYSLEMEQMAWRAKKIEELKDPLLFKQEYPATPAEAFQVTGIDSFIGAGCIMRARRTVVPNAVGPIICGVDPARFGDDTTDIILRRGRVAFGLERYAKKDTMEVAGICRTRLERKDPYIDYMFIDVGGLGAGVYDRLKEMGFCAKRPAGMGSRVRPVNYGEAAADPERFRNKRAEMWSAMKDWLEDVLPVQIPDDDVLHTDLMGPGYKYDSATRLLLESKEDMRARGQSSPNSADALCQTFAEPVRMPTEMEKARASLPPKAYDPLENW